MNKLVLLLCAASFSTFAAEQTSTSSTEVKVKKEKKVDKADELITNRRFRAQNGSLSNLSMNASISYNGGSLEKPLAADRPNISNAGDTTSIAGISGEIGASYRLNKLNRLGLSAGLQMLAPFNSSIDSNDSRAEQEFKDNRGKLDVSNPYFSYTNMNKFFGVQTISSLGIREYTASNLTDIGYANSIEATVNTMYDFGGSAFSIGALVVYSKYLFDKTDESYDEYQNGVVWGFLPQAEYVINDTFNLRTIVRSNWYQNNNQDGASDFTQRAITQSVGLGISVNRDVFIYPNIQFVNQNMQASNTNIGLTANINMF